MKHVVEVTEYLVKRVVVEADTATDAKAKVELAYTNEGSIVLDYEDFYDSIISYVGEASNEDIEIYMEI